MPELPDVEGFRRALAGRLPGSRVRHVHVADPAILRNTSPQSLGRRLSGRRFETPRRHGKWLMLPAGGPTVLVHSGMTGRPYYADSSDAALPHERLVIEFDDGALRYSDQRKLRGVWLAPDDDAIAGITGPQGPDALGLKRPRFADLLRGRRGGLKSALTDQSLLAGLGNLLADEICWQACLNPDLAVSALGDGEVARLYGVMCRVLHTSVRHRCVPALRGWLTSVRDGDSAACPRCGTKLRRGRINGRATRWCPRCQPAS